MAPRKKSSKELIRVQARRGRILARQAEENPPKAVQVPLPTGPNPELVAAYVAAYKREIKTFSKRRVPGESITREYGAPYDWPDAGPGYLAHGAIYNFHEGLLRGCRDYAKEVLADHATAGTYLRELCERFLADLSTGAERGRYYDVEATKNCERMIAVFANPEKFIPWIRLIAVLEFLCLKDADGEYVLPAEELLNFNPDDLKTIDTAILALKAAA